MRHLLLLFLLALSVLGRACLWDSDTIAVEAEGHMDLVRVLTGRFERNPPLYYQMRLERTQRELITHPEKLELYDDAAVAADRLGNDVLAIQIIEKKRKQMESAKLGAKHEHWYRYFANAGTFHAHDEIAGGLKDKKELKLGRDLIAKAIEVNPNAHFGRESSQLLVLDWLLQGETKSLENFVYKEPVKRNEEQFLKGFAGLVLLGNAWESPDIYVAIGSLAGRERNASLAIFAKMRMDELLKSGKHFAKMKDDEAPESLGEGSLVDDARAFDKQEYSKLRAEAISWDAARTDFMLRKLKLGKHPDTDKDFWSGYIEKPAPEISPLPFNLRFSTWFREGGVLFLCPGLSVALVILLVWRSRVKAKRRMTAV